MKLQQCECSPKPFRLQYMWQATVADLFGHAEGYIRS